MICLLTVFLLDVIYLCYHWLLYYAMLCALPFIGWNKIKLNYDTCCEMGQTRLLIAIYQIYFVFGHIDNFFGFYLFYLYFFFGFIFFIILVCICLFVYFFTIHLFSLVFAWFINSMFFFHVCFHEINNNRNIKIVILISWVLFELCHRTIVS